MNQVNSDFPSPDHKRQRRPRPKVLVIEDNRDMRMFLRRVLARQGYQFLEAADARQGLAVARREHPDLILMDLSLPEMDGLEATRRLKSDAQLGRIPVLAVTAHARPADEQQAIEAGCDGYLSKPYRLQDFLALVRSLLTGGGD